MNGEAVHAAPPLRPAISRLVTAALWIVAGALLTGWLSLAVLHFRDDYRVTHLQGIWIAIAEGARAGQLYPALFDGEHYAGTRWMPLPILANAAASGLAGDPLIGGKALAGTLMATLLVLAIVVLRQVSCPWPLSAALAAGIVGTETGLQAGTTIGGDLLTVVLQVGALAVALRRRSGRCMLAAGGLAGLAVASKLTGVWALLAILTWLAAQRQWRSAAIFTAGGVGAAVITLGTVQLLTGGGLSAHLLAFSVAGVQSAQSLLRGPNQVLYNLLGNASGTVVLVPLAVLGVLVSSSAKYPTLIHLALGFALLLLFVVYTDLGTGANQLLDFIVLTALAVGYLAGRVASSTDAATTQVLMLTIAVAVLWAGGLDLVRTVGFDVRLGAAALKRGEHAMPAAHRVARMVTPGEEVFAEDPSISVALGRRPVVMDPFMLTRLDRAHPQWVDPLIARILDRQFDLVALLVPLEDRTLDFWWTDFHFGPRIADALRSSYRPDGRIGPYYLYRPVR